MFFQQFQRERFLALRQRAIAHHVREHDRGELALFGVFERHEWIKTETSALSKSFQRLPANRENRHLEAFHCGLALASFPP